MYKLALFGIVFTSLCFTGCETARPGGPAATHRAQRDDITYNVALSRRSAQAYYAKGSKMAPNMFYYADRRIVFRGKNAQAVPEDMREAVIALEKLYCESLIQRDTVSRMVNELGEEVRQDYLRRTSGKVKSESYQKLVGFANTWAASAYVNEKASKKINDRIGILQARAEEALAQQTKAVNLLAKHGISVYRVFSTNDGMKEVQLPQ